MSDPAPDPRSLRLNAALDGELDAANALALEQDLAADPALAAEYRALQAVREAVRRHAPREAAPKALVESVLTLADAAEPPGLSNVVPLAPRPSWRPPQGLPLAASFAVLGFAAGAALMALRLPDASQGVADGLVSDFARAAVAGQPFDVASSDRHTVKPWLAGRTTVSADIVDLSPQGFPLAGGRVSVVDRIPAANRCLSPQRAPCRRDRTAARRAGAAVGRGSETVDGYHVARWTDPTSPMSRSRTWTKGPSPNSSRFCARRRRGGDKRAARAERAAPDRFTARAFSSQVGS